MRPPMKGFGGRQLTFDITQIQNNYGAAGVQTFLGSATMKPRLGVRHAGYPDLCNEKIEEQPAKNGAAPGGPVQKSQVILRVSDASQSNHLEPVNSRIREEQLRWEGW